MTTTVSCRFGDSVNYMLENCNIYVADESQGEETREKNLCELCLRNNCVPSDLRECDTIKRCYICFTKAHHTAFCPDQFTASKLFVPNIDHDLFDRFMALLNPYEKYLLAFRSPSTFNVKTYPHVKFVDDQVIYVLQYNIPYFLSLLKNDRQNIIVCKNYGMWCSFASSCQCEKFTIFTTNSCKLLAENIHFAFGRFSSHYANFSFQDFSLILSTRTKFLSLSNVKFDTNIRFEEILQYAPNIKGFEFNFFNTHRRNYDWIKCKYEKDIMKLTIKIDFLFIHFEELVIFMTQNTPTFKIDLFVNQYTLDNQISKANASQLDSLSRKLLEYLIPTKSSNEYSVSLYFQKKSAGIEVDKCLFVGSFYLFPHGEKRAGFFQKIFTQIYALLNQMYLYLF